MSADLIYRIIGSRNFIGRGYTNSIYIFYIFKLTSLLHKDSNGSGVIILSILSVLVFLCYECKIDRFYKNAYVVFLILHISTFARASIISHIILLLYFYLFSKRNIYFKCIIIFVVGIAIVNILIIFDIFPSIKDGSFISKIYIYNQTLVYLHNANVFQILFGNGNASSIDILGGIGGHNFISTLWIESGLISLILYILMFISMAIDVKSGWSIVVLPFFITSLSYTPLTTPYIFIALLLIKHTKLKRLSYKC
jgi:hypothetical protein